MNGRNDFIGSLTAAARDNPLAAALIGGGALWLLMGNRPLRAAFNGAQSAVSSAGDGVASATGSLRDAAMRTAESWRSDRGSTDNVQPMQTEQSGSSQSGSSGWSARAGMDGLRQAGASIADRASGMADRASSMADRASSMADRASGMAGRAAGLVSDGWSRTAEAARSLPNPLPAASAAYERTRSSLTEILEQQPLALGVVGLAIGAAVASAMPATQIEQEWAGDLSNQVRQDLGERAEAVKQTLREAAGTMKSEVGDMVAESADRLRQTGQDAVSAAREAARV